MSKHFTRKPKSGGWALARVSNVVDIVRHDEARHRFAVTLPEGADGAVVRLTTGEEVKRRALAV
jgi:hypothetical protein